MEGHTSVPWKTTDTEVRVGGGRRGRLGEYRYKLEEFLFALGFTGWMGVARTSSCGLVIMCKTMSQQQELAVVVVVVSGKSPSIPPTSC